jgi:5-methylcytosine-specific restriction protein A
MPMCCQAMYKLKRASDEIVSAPPKGKGASLTIRYLLPRR